MALTLIADAHPIVLEGIRCMLNSIPDIQIIAEVRSGTEALNKAAELNPDLVVMDLNLPELDGISVLRGLRVHVPTAKIVIFTSSDNQDLLIKAIELGCSGILRKTDPIELVRQSIQLIKQGGIWFHPEITVAIVHKFTEISHPAKRTRSQLSERQEEILGLIAVGYRNKEIAMRLAVSEQTVKNRVHKLLKKLGASDRVELALYAVQHGFAGGLTNSLLSK